MNQNFPKYKLNDIVICKQTGRQYKIKTINYELDEITYNVDNDGMIGFVKFKENDIILKDIN